MSRAQALRVLGKDYIVNDRSGDSVELAWDFGSWSVALVRKRVAQVSVTVRGQKTPAGIGPGSTWRALRHAYPHGLCTVVSAGPVRFWNEYLVAQKGGAQTIYLGSAHQAFSAGKLKDTDWHVTEVHVRTPYVRLPEFAPNWPNHCRPDWRTADSPS
ncbi:MAG: hypothetical protein ACJ74P_07560 [Gaiellaceae bacterium]